MEKLVLASAQWCEPCKSVKKVIEVRKLNIEIKDSDDDRDFFVSNGIRSVPTLLVFKDDVVVEKITGSKDILTKIS